MDKDNAVVRTTLIWTRTMLLYYHYSYFVISEDKANRNHTRCPCPPSCTNIDYDAVVSTSYLSGTVLKSIRAYDRVPGDIKQRYGRARNVRVRVTADGKTVKYTIGRLHQLGKQMRRLLDTINVNLMADSTSIVEQLFLNIDAIVHRTTDEMKAFEGRMFDIATSKAGCGTKVSENTKNFSSAASLAVSLKPKDWQSFGEMYTEFILPDFEELYNKGSVVNPSKLKSAVIDMCGNNIPSIREKAAILSSTSLMRHCHIMTPSGDDDRVQVIDVTDSW